MNKVYGERAGNLLSAVLRLMVENVNEDDGRPHFEVYHVQDNLNFKGKKALVVIPCYPMTMAGLPVSKKVSLPSDAMTKHVSFYSLPDRKKHFTIDHTDTFYLPFNNLEKVKRPGPNMSLLLRGKN